MRTIPPVAQEGQDEEPRGISPGEGVANLHFGTTCRVWLEYLVMEPEEGEPGRETWIYEFESVGDGGYPAWLSYELDAVGWRQILGIETHVLKGGDDDESLDWLLREGILPGQVFCVELTPHYSRDYWTNECDIEIDVKIVARKPPETTDPQKIADLLEWAWALKDRHCLS